MKMKLYDHTVNGCQIVNICGNSEIIECAKFSTLVKWLF